MATIETTQPDGYAKLIKYTGRSRRVLGAELPLYHLLSGSSQLGYTISVDVCQDAPDRRLTFATLPAAMEYLAQLPGEEPEDIR